MGAAERLETQLMFFVQCLCWVLDCSFVFCQFQVAVVKVYDEVKAVN